MNCKGDLVGLFVASGLSSGLDKWLVWGGASTPATLPTGLGSPELQAVSELPLPSCGRPKPQFPQPREP